MVVKSILLTEFKKKLLTITKLLITGSNAQFKNFLRHEYQKYAMLCLFKAYL